MSLRKVSYLLIFNFFVMLYFFTGVACSADLSRSKVKALIEKNLAIDNIDLIANGYETGLYRGLWTEAQSVSQGMFNFATTKVVVGRAGSVVASVRRPADDFLQNKGSIFLRKPAKTKVTVTGITGDSGSKMSQSHF